MISKNYKDGLLSMISIMVKDDRVKPIIINYLKQVTSNKKSDSFIFLKDYLSEFYNPEFLVFAIDNCIVKDLYDKEKILSSLSSADNFFYNKYIFLKSFSELGFQDREKIFNYCIEKKIIFSLILLTKDENYRFICDEEKRKKSILNVYLDFIIYVSNRKKNLS